MPWAGSHGSSLRFRFQVKFFYLCQLAYWLHALPELYFQKVRKVRAGWVLPCALGMLEAVCLLGFGESKLWERVGEEGRGVNAAFWPIQEEIPRQLRCIALYLVHIAGAYLLK